MFKIRTFFLFGFMLFFVLPHAVFAQSEVSPTIFYCLGTTCPGVPSPTIPNTSPSPSMQPSAVPSSTPSGSAPSPTVDPCVSSSSTSTANYRRHHRRWREGLIRKTMRFLFKLTFKLLKLINIQPPQNPTPTITPVPATGQPSPIATITPTINPCPSPSGIQVIPSVSPSQVVSVAPSMPSQNPSSQPSLQPSPSASPSSSIPSEQPSVSPSTIPSAQPSQVISSAPSPSINPCDTASSVSKSKVTAQHWRHHHHKRNGFISKLMEFLMKLILELLKLINVQPPQPPAPPITPVPSSVLPSQGVTNIPSPVITPCVIPSPSKAPSSMPSQPALSTSPSPASMSGNILFEDDFNGISGAHPDQTKWADYCTAYIFGKIKCGNDETLDGQGHLEVPATATWGSGLVTDGKYSFDFGTVSAWIKLPKTPGYWPAFWTLNRTQGTPGVTGEIDIMEGYTTWLTISHFAVHAWDKSELWGDGGECNSTADLSTGFHKYTANIEPDQITFYLDDQLCGSGSNPITKAGRSVWPFAPGQPLKNYLMLDLAVGGAGGQQPTPSEPDKMVVDRVEVRSN